MSKHKDGDDAEPARWRGLSHCRSRSAAPAIAAKAKRKKKEPRDLRGAFPSMVSLALETFPNDTLGRRRSAASQIPKPCWPCCLVSPTCFKKCP